MQFNQTTTPYDGLIQHCEFLCFGDNSYGKISGSTQRLATFTRLLNQAYNNAVNIIHQNDESAQWQDPSATSDGIEELNLVDGTTEYTIDSSYVKLHKVYAADEGSNYRELIQKDVHDSEFRHYLEDNNASDGVPAFYDYWGDKLRLYPTPNYDLTDGLRLYVQTTPDYFQTSDTTQTSGLPTLLDEFLPIDASYTYAIAHDLPTANGIERLLARKTKQIEEHYGSRNPARPTMIKARLTRSR